MKKIISFLLAFSMLGAYVVRADEGVQQIFPGWKLTGNASIIDDGTGNNIVKLAGNGAEIMYELGGTNAPWMNISFIANLEDNIVNENGDVVITDSAIGTPRGEDNVNLQIGTNGYRLSYLVAGKFITAELLNDDTLPDMGEGRRWFKFTAAKDVWVDKHTNFYARATAGRTIYIDDLKIVSGGENPSPMKEYFYDFEYSYFINPDAVKGLSANGDGNNVTLTWRNPDKNVTSFKVLENGIDITDGAEFELAAGKYNKFVCPAQFGGVRKYTLITTTADGTVSQKVIGDREERLAKGGKYTADGTPLGGWTLALQSGSTPMYGGVTLDEYNKLDGDYSLRVNTGIETSGGASLNEAWNGGKFILYPETTGLTSGKNYKLTYSVKTLNGRGLHALYGEKLGGENISTTGAVSLDWKECEYVFTANDYSKLQLIFDGSADSFWLDGLTLYECDADGNVTGTENLLVNGSFDNEIPWPDYEITDNGIFRGTTEVSTLSAGTYKIKTVIKNHKVEDGVQAQVAALLKKDGIVVKSAASDITSAGIGETEIGFNFDIPDTSDGEYELYIFTWDSLKGMKIITPVKVVRD